MSVLSYSQTGSIPQNKIDNILILDSTQVSNGLIRKAQSEACERENRQLRAEKKKDSILIKQQNNTIKQQNNALSLSLDYGKKADSALKTSGDLNAEYAEERKRLTNKVGLLEVALVVVSVASSIILITN